MAASRKTMWWESSPGERYWLELVKDATWGHRLYSPANDSRYPTMRQVQVGDVVFHWLSERNELRLPPGLHGWSRVSGALRPTHETWEAQPSNAIPLSGYTSLHEPIRLRELQAYSSRILAIQDRIVEAFPKPYYLPWQRTDVGVKPLQSYLCRVPAAMVVVLRELRPSEDFGVAPRLSPSQLAGRTRDTSLTQRAENIRQSSDVDVLAAVHRQAVMQVIAHYKDLGYAIEEATAGCPYNLWVSRGRERRYVLVKGSTSSPKTVHFSAEEIEHVEFSRASDLAVVASVPWRRNGRSVATEPGRLALTMNWEPESGQLKPTDYRYLLA